MPDDNDTNAGGVLDGIDPSALAEDEKAPDKAPDDKTPQAEGTDAAADAEGGKDEQPPEAASGAAHGATDGEQEPAEASAADEAAEGEGKAEEAGDDATAATNAGDPNTAQPAAGAVKPTPPAPPAEDPNAAARQQRHERLATVNREINALFARLDADDYDEFTEGRKLAKLQIEAGNLREQIYTEEIAAANLRARTVELEAQERQFWGDYAAEHPLVGPRAQTLYQEEFDKTRKEYPKHSTDAVQLLATERFKHRVATLEGVKRGENAENKPKPKVPAPPAANKGATTTPAPGSGRLVPPGAAGRVAKPVTAEDQLAAAVGGSIKSLLA